MSDLIRISVIYNSKEIILDLNPLNDDNYSKLIKALEEQSGEKNIEKNFKLTALNSNIPYLLIDENNLWNILVEERKEDSLKILMEKKEINELDEEEEDIFSVGLKRITKPEFDDFDEYDQGSNNKNEEEKKEANPNQKEDNNKDNNIDNINLDNININNNENYNKNNIENMIIEDNKNEEKVELLQLNQEGINIKENKNEKREDIIKINNIKNIIKSFREDDKEEIIIEKKTKKQNNQNKPSIKTKIFENDFCSICENQLFSIKYICTLCEKIELCEQCEKNHHHPCFIYKSNFVSSIKETFQFIKKNYEKIFISESKFLSFTNTNFDISLSFIGDNNICFRPNKKIYIPIKVTNNSKKIINSSNFIILIKGNKLINLSYNENQTFNLVPKVYHIVKLKCETPHKLCSENISLELYSSKIKLKAINKMKININIEVNEDKNEENMNNHILINNNEMIICYNKQHKEILISLMENEFKEEKPKNVIERLIKHNWNKEKVIEKFYSKDNNNINKK